MFCEDFPENQEVPEVLDVRSSSRDLNSSTARQGPGGPLIPGAAQTEKTSRPQSTGAGKVGMPAPPREQSAQRQHCLQGRQHCHQDYHPPASSHQGYKAERNCPVNQRTFQSTRNCPVNQKTFQSTRNCPVNQETFQSTRNCPVNQETFQSTRNCPVN